MRYGVFTTEKKAEVDPEPLVWEAQVPTADMRVVPKCRTSFCRWLLSRSTAFALRRAPSVGQAPDAAQQVGLCLSKRRGRSLFKGWLVCSPWRASRRTLYKYLRKSFWQWAPSKWASWDQMNGPSCTLGACSSHWSRGVWRVRWDRCQPSSQIGVCGIYCMYGIVRIAC